MSSRRIITTYMALAGTYTLAASLIWSVNTLFLLDAGLSIAEVFLANALFSAGMVLFEIPTGVFADTLGRRISYLASVAILSMTTIVYLLAAEARAGLWVFGATSAAMGLGFTFYSGALEAWLVDALATTDDDQSLDRVFARGQQVNGAAMLIGTVAGGLLGQIDLSVPFAARAVLLVGVLAMAARLMHDVGFEPQPLRLQEIPARMRQQTAIGIAEGWNQPGLRLLMVAGAARGAFMAWAFYAAQPYFLELLERDAVWIVGLVTAGVSVATIAGNQVVEVASRRCGRRSTLLILGAIATTVSGVAIGLVDGFAPAVGALLVVALAMGVMMPVRQAYLHQVVDSRYRATVISFDAMVASVGGAGGQVGLGALAERRSYGAGYVVGGALTALAIPALVLLRRLSSPENQRADLLHPDIAAGADATCPSGLPSATGVEAIPVAALTAEADA